jgi:hypothetical protein
VTIDTPDLYGGATVTTKNIIRQSGLSTWTEVAGAATFERDPGTVMEVVFGQGSDDDTDEPFGCKIEYVVPCSENPRLSAAELCTDGGDSGVIDDAVEGDLSVTMIDPEDQNSITGTEVVDIDNGDVMSLKTTWQGAYEEDYGNRFTPCGNTLVYHFHQAGYTNMKATDLNGVDYPPADVPGIHSVVALHKDKGYKVPVLKSNMLWEFYTVADVSGAGIEANQTTGNSTLTLYDNNWYIDNDVTPSVIRCGAEDEDDNDLGSNGADTFTMLVAGD